MTCVKASRSALNKNKYFFTDEETGKLPIFYRSTCLRVVLALTIFLTPVVSIYDKYCSSPYMSYQHPREISLSLNIRMTSHHAVGINR